MDIFISWAGGASEKLGKALHQFIKDVLTVEPFNSQISLGSGQERLQRTLENLNKSNVGIICLTPENLSSEWVLFEAGAIYKNYPQSESDNRVCTYLYGLEKTSLEPPLGLFDATEATKEETLELLKDINEMPNGPGRDNLEKHFDMYWEEFKDRLDDITLGNGEVQEAERSTQDMVKEILEKVRDLERNQPNNTFFNYGKGRRHRECDGVADTIGELLKHSAAEENVETGDFENLTVYETDDFYEVCIPNRSDLENYYFPKDEYDLDDPSVISMSQTILRDISKLN